MSSKTEPDTCPNCGAELSPAARHCVTCKKDAGAPNVRECQSDDNTKALLERFSVARGIAESKDLTDQFDELADLVDNK